MSSRYNIPVETRSKEKVIPVFALDQLSHIGYPETPPSTNILVLKDTGPINITSLPDASQHRITKLTIPQQPTPQQLQFSPKSKRIAARSSTKRTSTVATSSTSTHLVSRQSNNQQVQQSQRQSQHSAVDTLQTRSSDSSKGILSSVLSASAAFDRSNLNSKEGFRNYKVQQPNQQQQQQHLYSPTRQTPSIALLREQLNSQEKEQEGNNNIEIPSQILPIDFSTAEIAFKKRNIAAGITLREFEADLLQHEISNRTLLRDAFKNARRKKLAYNQFIADTKHSAEVIEASSSITIADNLANHNYRPHTATNPTTSAEYNVELQQSNSTFSRRPITSMTPNTSLKAGPSSTSRSITEDTEFLGRATSRSRSSNNNNNNTLGTTNNKRMRRTASYLEKSSDELKFKKQNSTEEFGYLKDTLSNSLRTFGPRNNRHLLLFGKEINHPVLQRDRSCSSSSRVLTTDYSLSSASKTMPLSAKNNHNNNNYPSRSSASVSSNLKTPSTSQQSQRRQTAVTATTGFLAGSMKPGVLVSDENKRKFKENIKRLGQYGIDLAEKYGEDYDENSQESSNLAKPPSDQLSKQDQQRMQQRINKLLSEKHDQVSTVVNKIDKFQDVYYHIQYGLPLQVQEKLNELQEQQLLEQQMIKEQEELEKAELPQQQQKPTFKSTAKKIMFANRIQLAYKKKVAENKQPPSLYDNIESLSHLLYKHNPSENQSATTTPRKPQDKKAAAVNKIGYLQSIYKCVSEVEDDGQSKDSNNTDENKELLKGLVDCWKYDKKGRLQIKGHERKKRKNGKPVLSAELLQKRILQVKTVLFNFLKKCVKTGADPNKALEGCYFSSPPFKRPGSYVLFISLKEGNLDIFNTMIKQNPEFIFEKDHLFQNCLHIAIQKGHRNVAIQLIHQGVDFDAKDIAGKKPLYYAIKCRMFDIAKYLLFRRANPWRDGLKRSYESLTSHSVMLRCIRKAKMADVCAQIGHNLKNIHWKYRDLRKILYLDPSCRTSGDTECLTASELSSIQVIKPHFEQLTITASNTTAATIKSTTHDTTSTTAIPASTIEPTQ